MVFPVKLLGEFLVESQKDFSTYLLKSWKLNIRIPDGAPEVFYIEIPIAIYSAI